MATWSEDELSLLVAAITPTSAPEHIHEAATCADAGLHSYFALQYQQATDRFAVILLRSYPDPDCGGDRYQHADAAARKLAARLRARGL